MNKFYINHLCCSASVTVYFNLEDNREKEFTRVVTWSSSEYLIDAKVMAYVDSFCT